MDLKYDLRGNLQPFGKNELSLSLFKALFVDAHASDSTRHTIFNNFNTYTCEMKKTLQCPLKIWIDGSFVTKKTNPKDIDIVTLLPYIQIEKHQKILEDKFLNRQLLKMIRVDAYIIRIYPENHQTHYKTSADLIYWEHWFSKSRKNRAGKRFAKGYVELKL